MKDSFQNRLNEALYKRKMRPVELSTISGIGKGRISQYMKGIYKPKADSLLALAKALDVSYRWLNGDDVPFSFFDQEEAEKPMMYHEFDQTYNTQSLANESLAFDNVKKAFGDSAVQALNIFTKLDTLDQGRAIGSMEEMLKNEKYNT